MVNPLSISLRSKKLGVLIRDARLAARKSIEECCAVIEVSPEEFEAYELGDKSLSLPKLEVLALYLGIPLDHFWGSKARSEDASPALDFDVKQLLRVRQRMIGALVRQARTQGDISLEELSQEVGIAPDQLEACENGEAELPLPTLEAFCARLNRPIEEFFDKQGPVGVWIGQQQVVQDFLQLPDEIQTFVAKPINRPYLELAQRLSEMSVDKLRALGEGILEITL